jgi:hypothetical protein
MPENAVYVGRPSRWGNPYVVGEVHPETGEERTAEEAVRLYRLSVTQWWPLDFLDHIRSDLAGKDLACWCPLVDAKGNSVPCHADVLLELANRVGAS